jgi:hypothetical protein
MFLKVHIVVKVKKQASDTNTDRDITYLLTHSIQHSPLEANRHAASQEIPRTLRNPKVHHLFFVFWTVHFQQCKQMNQQNAQLTSLISLLLS